ncbi:MAG: hypothetical protein ACKOPS_26865, partial [Cyanobium sp.]
MDATTSAAAAAPAPPRASLIPRAELAALNQLRDGPAWIRLASHLLTIAAGGMAWGQQSWPLPLRLAGLAAVAVEEQLAAAGLQLVLELFTGGDYVPDLDCTP